MSRFHFENNLVHQIEAVSDILHVFKNADTQNVTDKEKNPTILNSDFVKNLKDVQKQNALSEPLSKSNICDIQMETGTGKTYTYTKTMFELNRQFGIYKFIVVVPTLAIKAGTKSFFEQSLQRFRDDYQKSIKLYEVKAQKSSKKKKEKVPFELLNFVKEDDINSLHVMLINQGMLNSKSLDLQVEQDLFGQCFGSGFDALSEIKPVMIIDEPHRFSQESKTWENIQKIHSQYILRFGATFKRYENLIHRLTSLDAFNQNLVKGVKAFVVDFKEANDSFVQFKGLNEGKEAILQLTQNGKIKKVELAKNEDLGALHVELQGIHVENVKSSLVEFSNGLSLGKNDKISPYSFSQTLQMDMLSQAVKEHFKIEKELFTRDGEAKIKPLSLFFIDDIEGYRDEKSKDKNSLKSQFEALIKSEIKNQLKDIENEEYKKYLQDSLKDISSCHGGYFSQDNSDKDEKIEKEVSEILHDKQSLLSLENTRRFIFSKWTLREGWDNPNVFQICKLRSSGSEISKLQEVGRGLRLPVNEFMNRVKDEQFYLNYFVDFSESDFVEKIKDEIEKSSFVLEKEEALSDGLKEKILKAYPNKSKREILNCLYCNKAIDDNDKFCENGWEKMCQLYPLAFSNQTLQKGKVVSSKDKKSTKTKIRVSKYSELKELWEKINQKVLLSYNIKSEKEFESLLVKFFKKELENNSGKSAVQLRHKKLQTTDKTVSIINENSKNLENSSTITMNYGEFSLELAKLLSVNLNTLHRVLASFDVNFDKWYNQKSLRDIHQNFKNWLLQNILTHQKVTYKKVSSDVHPTVFTKSNGDVKNEIDSANVGRLSEGGTPSYNYFFEEIFFDSPLEKENILNELEEVVVFTKIPSNSIRIPVAGGFSYSPDFAYVLKSHDGKQSLNLVVETKGTSSDGLRENEKQKIEFAKTMFNDLLSKSDIKVEFKTQFEAQEIQQIIEKNLHNR